MFSAFLHSRPLLRAFIACVLLAGLVGTAAASQVQPGQTQWHVAHAVAADLDSVGNGQPGRQDPADTVSAEDNSVYDTLVVPDNLMIQHALLPRGQIMTARASRHVWHSSCELRPPNV
jgi:hypothetical protein